MSRLLSDLTPAFRAKACELIALCVEIQLPVLIITTRRTLMEQEDAVRRGVSWTMKSKHLEGRAIDVCPYKVFRLYGSDELMWDAKDPSWQKIGAIGLKLDLKWGVIKNGHRIDLGHFEEIENATTSA